MLSVKTQSIHSFWRGQQLAFKQIGEDWQGVGNIESGIVFCQENVSVS